MAGAICSSSVGTYGWGGEEEVEDQEDGPALHQEHPRPLDQELDHYEAQPDPPHLRLLPPRYLHGHHLPHCWSRAHWAEGG